MRWNVEIEKHIHRLFEIAFESKSIEVMEECGTKLMELGLTQEQVEAGFIAGFEEVMWSSD